MAILRVEGDHVHFACPAESGVLDKAVKFGMIETYPAISDQVALEYRQPVDLIGCLALTGYVIRFVSDTW